MTWLIFATAAQFVNAVVAIIDKYLVTDEGAIPRPFVYAFYSVLLSGVWLVIYFFSFLPGLNEIGAPQLSNVKTPTIQVVGMAFLAAYTLFIALVSLYNALKHADASDVMPVIGAVSAISTFGMSFLFLNAELSTTFIWGILLLTIGTFLVSQVRFTPPIILHTVHGGIFFALHYIAMKGLFLETSFDDGFFWSRVAFVLFALSLLLVPAYFDKIKKQTKSTSKNTGLMVFANKMLAGVAAFMLLKATDLGDVAVVQAMDGLKFVFILAIGILFGRYIPKSAGENEHDFRTVLRKFLYVGVIAIGFVLLFVA